MTDMNPEDRLVARGRELGRKLGDLDFEDLLEQIAVDADAELADEFVRGAFGVILSRPELPLHDRLLVAVAALGALGFPERLRWMLKAALRVGVNRREIREVMVQLVPYCGWATGLNALTVARELLGPESEADRAAEPEGSNLAGTREELRELGWKTARKVNPLFDRVADGVAALDPDLVPYLTETAYGYVYNRPGLSLRGRELVAVAILTALNQVPQLKYHIRGALNAGAEAAEIREVIIQMHLHAGWPATLAGLAAWREMTGGDAG
jgi:4-carboxymuconolactone decarboxylase